MPLFKELPNNKATILHNERCAYCGAPATLENPLTSEHVVGRRFVPRGSLAQGWCLILEACKSCNNKKSDLEDDISAITLFPDIGVAHADPKLAIVAERKAKGAFSRRTGKKVAASAENMEVGGEFKPGAHIKMSLVGPPQIDSQRMWAMAHFHLQGFFYLISYDYATRLGGFMPGSLMFLPGARRPDWGNCLFLSFAELVRSWTPRVVGTGASGFFRIAMRREPSGKELWSFALEWNKSFRVAGFFGESHGADECTQQLRWPEMTRLSSTERFREEIALSPEVDVMFE